MVNVPSFNVRVESEKKINLAPLSPFETNKPSRTSRKKQKGKKAPEAAENWDDVTIYSATYILFRWFKYFITLKLYLK